MINKKIMMKNLLTWRGVIDLYTQGPREKLRMLMRGPSGHPRECPQSASLPAYCKLKGIPPLIQLASNQFYNYAVHYLF